MFNKGKFSRNLPLHEKCPNMGLSPYLVQMRENTDQKYVFGHFSPSAQKCKNPNKITSFKAWDLL